MDRIGLSSDAYKSIPITNIIFSYGIRDGEYTPTFSLSTKDIKYHSFNRGKLPVGFIPNDYGKIISKIGNSYIVSLNKNTFITLRVEENLNELENHITFVKNGEVLYLWKDKIISFEDRKLTRYIGKSIINYNNGEISKFKVLKKTSGIKNKLIPKNNNLSNNFITMDFETILINNNHIPYLISWFDGSNTYSYNIIDYLEDKSQDLLQLDSEKLLELNKQMILDVMTNISRKKYKGYKIYLHNFAKFDGIFMIKHLASIGNCWPKIHKGRIISCKFKLANTKYQVTFLDSYLLIPSSLRKLCKSFGIIGGKGIFPYKFNNINYSGDVPDIKYFDNISLEEYKNYKALYKNKIWSFRDESIIYCNYDCIALYKILSRFNELIFRKFSLNITKYPTLPSLAFGIFRTHYLVNKKDIKTNKDGNSIPTNSKVHMLSGKIANNIRLSYTGGATDMFIPKNIIGTKIYSFDVNSLYPSVMLNNKYPVGSPVYFEGNLFKNKVEGILGFFYCKITAPDNLNIPILQTHVKTEEGTRTISPLGTWEGMYLSEELYNAKKFGYKFEVMWGYTFKSDYIFKGWVDNLYNMRLSYPKSDPMNYICKILLNYLYGRFGMDDSFTKTHIISYKDYPKFDKDNKSDIINVIDLNGNYLIETKSQLSNLKTLMDNGFETHNVNIAIASAVTAYARIHMSQFKDPKFLKENNINLYYTDTDSLYFDGPIPDHLISSTILGKLKLEGIFDEAIFLAPKVYALKNLDSEIIKIKGLSKKSINSNGITLDSLYQLLLKGSSSKFNQEKWYKHLDKELFQY